MKKYIWQSLVLLIVLAVGGFMLGRYAFPNNGLASLPKPELSEGQRGELGIDKNINESTIDKYLGRSDAVYRDMRLLKDPADYEAIGGDAYLSGFVKGFEVVPLPFLVNVTGLPAEVGDTYKGKTLFTNINGKYSANYKESLSILEALFPKDKIIFLMCGGGGYAGMTKAMLVALGWDADKIYDVGGYWFYEGENNVEVKRTRADGEVVYDFYKVPYHNIDFSILTEGK
jgi:rhodanese-related sulfurtransferase